MSYEAPVSLRTYFCQLVVINGGLTFVSKRTAEAKSQLVLRPRIFELA
jgi:hypothetical protein